MAAIVKFLLVFFAIFAVAFAGPTVEKAKKETKAVKATPSPAAVTTKPSVAATKAHDHFATVTSKPVEQTRPKRSCKKLGFESKSGRKIEGSHGC